ncbi:tetratricopeptide repeat protein [Streptomyces plumbiresistens]|uniref:Orc1-like AAA ATPase domain-containing protein n=1 Tax=Streptomyces plumbiresistens TaxID=511811 RepID=A0ABP7TM85_9ACTN
MTDDTRPTPDAAVSNEITGGVFFHAVIQGRDITVQLPPQITPALSGLPAPSPTFVGRDDEVETLLQTLAPDREDGKPTLLSAVAGMAGVGKTEVALQVAHEALNRNGWFAGGVLFIDLFGYDNDRRLTSEQALDGMLRALGIPGEHIPDQLQDRSRLYRSVLAAYAEQGRRILVVIDNAFTAGQAKPLIPGDGVTGALVTSRHTLDIGAHLHDLDVLSPDASVDLIRQALHHARGSNDTRVDDQPEQAKVVAELCGRLPLALQIVAALLADIPTRPIASMADDLADAQRRLGELRREDRAVRAAFDLSYQHLDTEQARLFRLLPLNPGPDISTESAVCLVEDGQSTTRHLLEDLARAHLIEPGQTWDRWRLHDLIRLYAEERGRLCDDSSQRRVALGRLYDHYVSHTIAADTHLELPENGKVSPLFADRAAAISWLEAERANLTSAALTASNIGRPEACIDLSWALDDFFDWRKYVDDWIAVAEAALKVARDHSSRLIEGRALNRLGTAVGMKRRFEEALDYHQEAAEIFREINEPSGEGDALHNQGMTLVELRRFDEAVECHQKDLEICRSIGDRRGEGFSLTALGVALRELRRFDKCVDLQTQAIPAFHEIGDRHNEGRALSALGSALAELYRHDEAVDAFTQAASIIHESGDDATESAILQNLGRALHEADRDEEAIEALHRGIAIARRLGDHHGEGVCRNSLGLCLRDVNRLDEAVTAHEAAREMLQSVGDQHGEASAWNNLGRDLQRLDRIDESIDAHMEAAKIFEEIGDRYGLGQALCNLGLSLLAAGRASEAADAEVAAAALYGESNDLRGEGLARNYLGLSLTLIGRYEEAINAHKEALVIYGEIDDLDGRASALLNIGAPLWKMSRFDEAIDAFQQAAAAFTGLGNEEKAATALTGLAIANNEWRASQWS